MESNALQCAIIGSGPAGFTAAIYAARAGMQPVIFTGAEPGGQLTTTSDVENFPGYPMGIGGPEMMADLQKQAERFGTVIKYAVVTAIDLDSEVKLITLDSGEIHQAHTIIISTGASAKWLGLPGEMHFNNHGVSACAVCDGFFFRGQEVAVVGGGDTACEEASYLAKLCKKVTMIVRRDELRASLIMQQRVKNTPNIEIRWNTETLDFHGNENLEAITIRNNVTQEVERISIAGFFVAIGHKPNTDIFKGQLEMDDAGYLITKPRTTETNLPGVFACGDAQDNIYRQAVTAAGTGCMAALDAERYLAALEIA
jgi:thioredoxin reductase (NADPH)